MVRDFLFLSGESGLTLKLVFSRDDWMHSCSATRLVPTEDGFVRREIFPREKLKGLVYLADVDDKQLSFENLCLLNQFKTKTVAWPRPQALLSCHDRFVIHDWLTKNKHIQHATWSGLWVNRLNALKEVNSFPFVVKVGNTHRGQGKYLVKTLEEWNNFPKWDGVDALVEPFFEGISVRALKVGKRIWGIKTKNKNSWIKNSAGAEQNLVRLDKEIRNHAQTVSEIMCLDIAGVDYIVDKSGKFHFLELNQYPGLAHYGEKITKHVSEFLLKKMQEIENQSS
jgi:glutathione synthase/RimK-type ligase-like ATP-grasp enzyme